MLCGCGDAPSDEAPEVVVYTALDRVYAEPILLAFEEETGIRVRAKYDAEAAKTTGLINQIIARRDAPECDVLWNNEVVQTEHLATLGLLQPYASPSAERFAPQHRDPDHLWTGFAARARVIIYNTARLRADEVPRSLDAMTDPVWRGRCAIALPFFGTTLTHMAVLHEQWGAERLEGWLQACLDNGVAVAPGNGPVRDLVAAGEVAFGLTDTDDAHGAMVDGKPVAVVVPDAGYGPVLIPNSVGLIANAPNPDTGQKLIDYLLSAEVERKLAASRSAQIPLGRDLIDLETPWDGLVDRAAFGFDVSRAAADKEAVVQLLREVGFDR
ncbi:MAG: extracellular solute-binding protein [Planctomycetota bacterium]